MVRTHSLRAAALAVALLFAFPTLAARLTDELGRSDVPILSAAYPLAAGIEPAAAGVPARLERLGYTRVHGRPERPGEYFWGLERFCRAPRRPGASSSPSARS